MAVAEPPLPPETVPGDVPLLEGTGTPLDGRMVAIDIGPPGFVPEGIATTLVCRVGTAELEPVGPAELRVKVPL